MLNYSKARVGGRVVSGAVVVATGVTADRHPEVPPDLLRLFAHAQLDAEDSADRKQVISDPSRVVAPDRVGIRPALIGESSSAC